MCVSNIIFTFYVIQQSQNGIIKIPIIKTEMMKKLLILFVGLHVYPPMWILTHTYKLQVGKLRSFISLFSYICVVV